MSPTAKDEVDMGDIQLRATTLLYQHSPDGTTQQTKHIMFNKTLFYFLRSLLLLLLLFIRALRTGKVQVHIISSDKISTPQLDNIKT